MVGLIVALVLDFCLSDDIAENVIVFTLLLF